MSRDRAIKISIPTLNFTIFFTLTLGSDPGDSAGKNTNIAIGSVRSRQECPKIIVCACTVKYSDRIFYLVLNFCISTSVTNQQLWRIVSLILNGLKKANNVETYTFWYFFKIFLIRYFCSGDVIKCFQSFSIPRQIRIVSTFRWYYNSLCISPRLSYAGVKLKRNFKQKTPPYGAGHGILQTPNTVW